MNKLKSRKLWMTVSGVLSIFGADFAKNGEISVNSIMAATAIIAAYLVSQGWVDGKEKEQNK